MQNRTPAVTPPRTPTPWPRIAATLIAALIFGGARFAPDALSPGDPAPPAERAADPAATPETTGRAIEPAGPALGASGTREAQTAWTPPGQTADAGGTFELGCDTVPPDAQLGIQENYIGGDCLSGPPFTPGNMVGFVFPRVNDVEDGQIVAVKVFFQELTLPDLSANIYLWTDDGTGVPDDQCGAELFKLIEAPIQADSAFTTFDVVPPVPMPLDGLVWVGVVYPFTTAPEPTWYLGRIEGPNTPGLSYANLTGDHADWFDLSLFPAPGPFGHCFAVRLVLEPQSLNLPPVASTGGPYCGSSAAPLQFDGTGSFDPEGATLTYDWDFGDGAAGNGPTPSHTYAPGTSAYTVTLVVSDGAAQDTSVTVAGVDVGSVVDVPSDVDLGAAFELAEPCQIDTIRVAPGTYEGAFQLENSDAAVLGVGGAESTLLQNSSSPSPVLLLRGGAPEIRGFTITGIREGIVSSAAAAILDCRVIDCGRTGMVVSGEQPALVASCLVARNSLAASGGGIDVRGQHVIEGCTIDRNGVFGVRASRFSGGEVAIVDRSNITRTPFGPGLQCIGVEPAVGCTDIWQNVVNLNCGSDAGGNLSVDPLYCDPANLNYNYFSDSPVVDVPGCGTLGIGSPDCGLSASIVRGAATDAEGQPIAGLTVTATDLLTETVVSSAITGPTGQYTLTGLPPGGYRLEILTEGTFYLGEYYDDAPSYDPANVALAEALWLITPQAVSGYDFQLDLGGVFSGNVVDATDGTPLSDVAVVPLAVPGGDTLRANISDGSGAYRSVPLPAGTYLAWAPGVAGYVGEFYRDAGTPGEAMPIDVEVLTDLAAIDLTLERSAIGVPSTASPPRVTRLGKPVPNPFNPSTVIPFELAEAAAVRLSVYDVQGRRLRLLIDGPMPAGRHRARWDGRLDQGAEAATGIYLIQLETPGWSATERALLLR